MLRGRIEKNNFRKSVAICTGGSKKSDIREILKNFSFLYNIQNDLPACNRLFYHDFFRLPDLYCKIELC